MIPEGGLYLDDYIITEDGDIFSLKNVRFLKKSLNSCGYERAHLQVDGNSKKFIVHRLVAKFFVENPKNYNVVNHIDGNKLNNHFTNLEWTTQSKNVLHAYETGLASHHRGESMHNSKLTEKKVYEIFELRDKNIWTFQKIADYMDVTISCIHSVYKGRTWKHITKGK